MVRGNHAAAIREMKKLQDVLRRLGELPRVLAVEAAPEIDKLVQRQFDEGRDPYGQKWAPLAASTVKKGRHPPPLTDTRKLRDGTRVVADAGGQPGIRLTFGAAYGIYHQLGFRNARGGKQVPARRIFPRASLPRSWVAALERAAKRIVEKAKAGLA